MKFAKIRQNYLKFDSKIAKRCSKDQGSKVKDLGHFEKFEKQFNFTNTPQTKSVSPDPCVSIRAFVALHSIRAFVALHSIRALRCGRYERCVRSIRSCVLLLLSFVLFLLSSLFLILYHFFFLASRSIRALRCRRSVRCLRSIRP